MAITIIVRDGKPRGETRSSIDKQLFDAGWGSTFRNEEDADKCAFVERKLKEQLGADSSQVPASVIKRIGSKGKIKK